jgi:hypothetical protein
LTPGQVLIKQRKELPLYQEIKRCAAQDLKLVSFLEGLG